MVYKYLEIELLRSLTFRVVVNRLGDRDQFISVYFARSED